MSLEAYAYKGGALRNGDHHVGLHGFDPVGVDGFLQQWADRPKWTEDKGPIEIWNRNIQILEKIQNNKLHVNDPRIKEKVLSLLFAAIAIGLLVGTIFGARAVNNLKPGMDLAALGTGLGGGAIYGIFSYCVGKKSEKALDRRGGYLPHDYRRCTAGLILIGSFDGVARAFRNVQSKLDEHEKIRSKGIIWMIKEMRNIFTIVKIENQDKQLQGRLTEIKDYFEHPMFNQFVNGPQK